MKVRGGKALRLFDVEQIVAQEEREDQRGRDPELLRKRNEHMMYRIFYYRRNAMLAREWALKKVAQEFYLTESTLGQFMEDNYELAEEVANEKPTIQELRKKYPFFRWENTVE